MALIGYLFLGAPLVAAVQAGLFAAVFGAQSFPVMWLTFFAISVFHIIWGKTRGNF